MGGRVRLFPAHAGQVAALVQVVDLRGRRRRQRRQRGGQRFGGNAGAAVVVNYSASKEDADRIVADIKAKGGKAIAVKGDVAKADDMGRLFEETKKTFGRMDVLVNNAGIYRFARLEEITEDEFERVLSE